MVCSWWAQFIFRKNFHLNIWWVYIWKELNVCQLCTIIRIVQHHKLSKHDQTFGKLTPNTSSSFITQTTKAPKIILSWYEAIWRLWIRCIHSIFRSTNESLPVPSVPHQVFLASLYETLFFCIKIFQAPWFNIIIFWRAKDTRGTYFRVHGFIYNETTLF